MNRQESLGFRLRMWRRRRGISLKDAARQVGVSSPLLLGIENGQRRPSEEVLVKISEVYRWPLGELRKAWGRPDPVINRVRCQNRACEFLELVKGFTNKEWDGLFEYLKGA